MEQFDLERLNAAARTLEWPQQHREAVVRVVTEIAQAARPATNEVAG